MPFENTPKTEIPKLPGPMNWHAHYEAILNWVLLNPHRNDSEGARELGFTHAWFSLVLNSDMFQERLRERARDMGIELGVAAQGIYGKMLHAANLAMDETIRKLETKSASESFVSGTRDTLLGKLGFDKQSQSPARAQNSTTVHVHANSLREARTILDSLGSTVEDITPNPVREEVILASTASEGQTETEAQT